MRGSFEVCLLVTFHAWAAFPFCVFYCGRQLPTGRYDPWTLRSFAAPHSFFNHLALRLWQQASRFAASFVPKLQLFIDRHILEEILNASAHCSYREKSYVSKPESPHARRVGKTGRADRACSAECSPPTSNPAARATRAALTPTHFVLFGAFAP